MTDTNTTDIVPLPPQLSTCGCRFAPNQHATNCAVAIEFDSIPLRDRPEYKEGQRFAAISWDFPLRISARINLEVELDPIAVILEHADEYERFEPEADYEEWEKPLAWLRQRITDEIDVSVWFGSRRLSRDYSDFGQMEEYPRWSSADTDRLNEALHKRIDPNQGVLEV